MSWFAIYTKPRNEKKVADRLSREGFEVYLPMHEQKRKWSDRYKVVKVPIISSYVFIKCNEQERELVLQDPGVSRFVFWLGKPAIIKDEEIKRIQYVLKEATPDDSFYMQDIPKGQKAKITSGNFAGEEGVIVSVDKKEYRVLLDGMGVQLVLSKMHVGSINN